MRPFSVWANATIRPRSIRPPMPIVVGAPRSGTTLLRLMLDAHPQLAIPPETGFLVAAGKIPSLTSASRRQLFELVTNFPPEMPGWRDYCISAEDYWQALLQLEPFTAAEGIREFYRLYAARFGKLRYGDKTPGHARGLEAIEQLLPEAVFVHLIRDGRDVALSWRPLWFSPGHEMETLARAWRDWVTSARRAGANCRSYLEVRYEELIAQPQRVLESICRAIDLPFDPGMLDYHTRSAERLAEHAERRRVDGSLVISHSGRLQMQRRTMQPPDASRVLAWKSELSPDQQQRFIAEAGELLQELGYDRSVSLPKAS